MKILVICTGGTIGSTVNKGFISPDKSKSFKLIEMYKASNKNNVEFEIIQPYTLLSENLTGRTLSSLGLCLLENASRGYDGIIVTHGTDTLQYSAAAMGYLLANARIPILFVSSNLVLDHPAANGIHNFTHAVEFIMQKHGSGVFVSYRNSDNITYIHRGTRLLPHLGYSDELFSILGQYYGLYRENVFIPNPGYRSLQIDNIPIFTLPDSWNSHILRIFPYPGMEYPALSDNIKAILLDTYHSGTLCSTTPNMTSFYNEANARKLPVFLTGANHDTDYESVTVWKRLGIHTLPPASPIAMYIKLWMAIGSCGGSNDIILKELMETPIGEDIIP